MISHRLRCIFVHIPKTGGTSIEDVIWPGERTEAELWAGFVTPMRNRYQTGGLQHLLARQIRTEVGETLFASYFKFAIVRNPWDKIVSQYAYMQRRPDLRQYIGLREDAPLDDYLDRIAVSDHVQWMPQLCFVKDDDGTDLVDVIGRYETLAADAARIFDRLGLPGPDLPHLNRSERDPDYRGYFNAQTRATVARLYGADIDHFGYRF